MNTKNLTLRSINSLLSETFSVPKYQRGYRWTAEEVTDLLEDLLEFQENSEDKPREIFYCLQPLVVSRDKDKLVVVDGQQRLTTIFLILTALDDVRKLLKVGKYTLTYETRSGSEQFLNNLVAEKRSLPKKILAFG